MKPIKAYTNVTGDDWVIADEEGQGEAGLGEAGLRGEEGKGLLSTSLVDNRGGVTMVKETLVQDSGYLESRQPDPEC